MFGFGFVGKLVEVAIDVLKIVATAICDVCKALGLVEDDAKVEEIGDRAIQAEEAGIGLEDFDTYEEYLKAINEFKLDPERSLEISEEEKMRKGTAVLKGALEERVGQNLDILIRDLPVFQTFLTPLRIVNYLQQGIGVNKLSDYLHGGLNRSETREMTELLLGVEKTFQPNKTEAELEDYLDSVRK